MVLFLYSPNTKKIVVKQRSKKLAHDNSFRYKYLLYSPTTQVRRRCAKPKEDGQIDICMRCDRLTAPIFFYVELR